MQNGFYGEKENGRESTAKDKMMETVNKRLKIRVLGGEDVLPNEWNKTAKMLRKTAETVLGVTFGKRKGDRETWWWNEKVQESIKEKKEAKEAWDKIRTENTKKIYKEKKSKAKKAVAIAKGRAYENLYNRLETKENEKDL